MLNPSYFPSEEEPHYVYLLSSSIRNIYKIGYSDNPNIRCKRIEHKNYAGQLTVAIELLCSSQQNAENVERHLHKCFAERRIDRLPGSPELHEWFSFANDELVDVVYQFKKCAVPAHHLLIHYERVPQMESLTSMPVVLETTDNESYDEPLPVFVEESESLPENKVDALQKAETWELEHEPTNTMLVTQLFKGIKGWFKYVFS